MIVTTSESWFAEKITEVIVVALPRFTEMEELFGMFRFSSALPQYFTKAKLGCAAAVTLRFMVTSPKERKYFQDSGTHCVYNVIIAYLMCSDSA